MNPLSIRIFASLALGLLIGAAVSAVAPDRAASVLAVAQPIGKLWLDALTMTVTPLVFGLVVTGIAGPATTDGAAGRAFVWFAVLLIGACAASALLSMVLLDVWPISSALAAPPAARTAPHVMSVGDWLTLHAGDLETTEAVQAFLEKRPPDLEHIRRGERG